MILLRSRFAPLPDTGQAASIADDGIDVLPGGIGSGKSLPAAFKLLRWIQRRPSRAVTRPKSIPVSPRHGRSANLSTVATRNAGSSR